jgi:two-component sensor histidine kinase
MRGSVNLTDEKFFNQKGAKFFRLFVQRIQCLSVRHENVIRDLDSCT